VAANIDRLYDQTAADSAYRRKQHVTAEQLGASRTRFSAGRW
jgi:hypothetical protein